MAIPAHYPPPAGATPIDRLLQTIRNRVPLLAEEEALVRATFQPRRYARHEHVFRAGEVCPHSCYIGQGVFREYHTDADNAEHTTRLAFEDYFTGDLQSQFNLEPSTFSIQCLEDAEVLTIDKAGYDHLFKHSPAFGETFRYLRNRSFNVAMQQLMEKTTKSAEQRYGELMREHPQLFQRVALKHIASWMGIQPETLSRIRKNTMTQPLS